LQTNKVVLWRLLLFMVVPLLGYAVLRSTSADMSVHAPHDHFYVVSLVSAISLALAITVGITAIRLRNIKISFLALSYVSLAAIFVLHGLSTPGFLVDHSAISGTAAQLSVVLAVGWLWLSSLSVDQPLVQWLAGWQRLLLPVWVLVLIGLCLLLWLVPELGEMIRVKQNPGKWLFTMFVVMMNGWTMKRYYGTYMASRFPLQLSVVYSAGWMIVAQLIIVTGEAWRLSWWLYHFLLLGSVIIMVSGIVRQYASSRSLSATIQLLFRSNPQDWIQTYMSTSVKELVTTTEARDAYTAGHNYRVALYALKLGEEMGLGSEELRAIAQGGLVHDVGKLSIPDHILNKPGKLTQEERRIIEGHPLAGYDLCKRLGFMAEELSVIRSHHEKWNGKGYPDQLAGEAIPLVARVTAVADVYDALTSSRAYRKALSHQEAMDFIVGESGRHFDPACVKAWVRLVSEQQHFFAETIRSSAISQTDKKL
jgi:HD-GYP domain-containing protein (c-di-GMP phosphodiesterase class II)